MPQLIEKRNGAFEPWSSDKINLAIEKAFAASSYQPNGNVKKVTDLVLSSINGAKSIKVEAVQNIIERTLMELGYCDVAKNFILYREKRREVRDTGEVLLDVAKTIDEYIGDQDWRINENANAGKSYPGLTLNINNSVQAAYCLNKFPEAIRTAHKEGFFHQHDLGAGLCGYCSGWSLYDIILEGFNLPEYCSSGPSKHFDTILSQLINFIGTLQNEWSGAQALSNFDTLLAPFIYYDRIALEKELGIKLSGEFMYKKVKQAMQRFVFNINTTSRWGGQTPFSNLTFDLVCPKHYADMPVIIGGEAKDKTYKEFDEERMLLNKAFLEVMMEGDSNGRVHTFPIPTYNITPNFPWESDIGTLLLEMTAKYGAPYFQNFINSDLNPEDIRSMCCRLALNKKELKEHLEKLTNKGNGLFGAGELTGSIGVVTLNLPKLAYLSKDKEDKKQAFFDLVLHTANLAKISLELKRKMLKNNMDRGMYPWSKRYLKHGFNAHFSTIGVIGGHEACLNLLGVGIDSTEGKQLMVDTLNLLRDKIKEFQKETGNLYNLEATPGEGTSYRLAKLDKKNHPDIITAGEEVPFYTNSTHLPVDYTNDPIAALQHQDALQTLYTGGTVLHLFLGEKATDLDSLKNLIVKALTLTKLPYISITPTFSICTDHGYIPGEHFNCPTCGKESEVYSRIVGYLRPVSRWGKGKKEEFKLRTEYRMVD